MATEEILLKYRADIGDLQAKVAAIEAQIRKTETQFANFDKTKKKALDSGPNKLESQLLSLGKTLTAAFAVERIIAFGKASVEAFAEAELNAKKLSVAVGVSGGLSKDFDRLIKQSEDLQKITVFSDDDIQKVQTMALQFGLTANQVESLTPVIADFAAATGQSLQEATSAVLRGLEGQGKGFPENRDEGLTGWMSGDTLDALLGALEGALADGDLEWRDANPRRR